MPASGRCRRIPAQVNTQLVKIMKVTTKSALTLILPAALLIFGAPDASAAKIKCWTNKDGVRECGNAVPPEYAQEGHQEINKRGMTVGSQERAKTPEELEKERLEQEEKERQAKLAEEQARQDEILLATFASEEDMKLAHEGKVRALDTRIKHTQALIAKLEDSLEALIQDAAKQERAGQKVSDETQEDIRRVKQQIKENRLFIEEREKEKVELGKQFQAEVERFRRLKAQN